MICNHTNHINLSGIWLYEVLCKTLKESSPVCSFLNKPYAEIWNSILKVSCSEPWVKRLNSGLSDCLSKAFQQIPRPRSRSPKHINTQFPVSGADSRAQCSLLGSSKRNHEARTVTLPLTSFQMNCESRAASWSNANARS